MPINIYNEETGEKLALLSDRIWDLPTQIDDLEAWLANSGINLQPNHYVADIGFKIRKNASGGGAVLSSKSMAIMGKIGMDVYFSEYH